jgi:hypothetical protein
MSISKTVILYIPCDQETITTRALRLRSEMNILESTIIYGCRWVGVSKRISEVKYLSSLVRSNETRRSSSTGCAVSGGPLPSGHVWTYMPS